MASHDLSNTKTTILGATPGVIPGIDRNPHDPDPPILAFFDFLAFFFFRFPLLFLPFFLPFPRILGVPQREKPLLFWGKKPLLFPKKSKVWRVRGKILICPSIHGAFFLRIGGGPRAPEDTGQASDACLRNPSFEPLARAPLAQADKCVRYRFTWPQLGPFFFVPALDGGNGALVIGF